jgi:hypothetical protein
MTHLLLHLPKRTIRTTRDLAMTLLPHGGQRAARQNAWAGMSADLAMSRARREAESVMELAIQRAHHRTYDEHPATGTAL